MLMETQMEHAQVLQILEGGSSQVLVPDWGKSKQLNYWPHQF